MSSNIDRLIDSEINYKRFNIKNILNHLSFYIKNNLTNSIYFLYIKNLILPSTVDIVINNDNLNEQEKIIVEFLKFKILNYKKKLEPNYSEYYNTLLNKINKINDELVKNSLLIWHKYIVYNHNVLLLPIETIEDVQYELEKINSLLLNDNFYNKIYLRIIKDIFLNLHNINNITLNINNYFTILLSVHNNNKIINDIISSKYIHFMNEVSILLYKQLEYKNSLSIIKNSFIFCKTNESKLNNYIKFTTKYIYLYLHKKYLKCIKHLLNYSEYYTPNIVLHMLLMIDELEMDDIFLEILTANKNYVEEIKTNTKHSSYMYLIWFKFLLRNHEIKELKKLFSEKINYGTNENIVGLIKNLEYYVFELLEDFNCNEKYKYIELNENKKSVEKESCLICIEKYKENQSVLFCNKCKKIMSHAYCYHTLLYKVPTFNNKCINCNQ